MYLQKQRDSTVLSFFFSQPKDCDHLPIYFISQLLAEAFSKNSQIRILQFIDSIQL